MSCSKQHDQHRQAPDHQHRAEVLDRRDRDPEHPARAGDHQLAGVAQVAGQEDHQTDLGELRRLEHEQPGDADAQVGTVGLVADPRQPGQDQQSQRDRHDHVSVLLELAVVPERHDRDREQDQAEHEPLSLLAGQRGIDPVDHHQPEAGQQGDQREHVRVRIRKRHPDEHVPRDAQPEEDRAVGQRHIRQHVGALDEHAREPSGQQQRRRDQADKLAVARGHRDRPGTTSLITSRSSPVPAPSPPRSRPTATADGC